MINFVSPNSQKLPQNTIYFKGNETRREQYSSKSALSQDELIIRKAQKEQKKQKIKQNLSWGLGIGSMLAVIGLCGYSIFGGKHAMKDLGLLTEKHFASMMHDCSKEKGFAELHLPPSLNKKLAEIRDKMARADVYKKLNLPEASKAMLLFGLPGTGKNTFTYALVKEIPKSELFCVDMTKVCGPYMGLPEKNLQNATEFAIKKANELKKDGKKLFIFFDEIDRVMMQDTGSSAKHSGDILTEFKMCFNKLKAQENITIIGATNKEIDPIVARKLGTGVMDEAMANRFGDKIRVELPTSEALVETVKDRFKDNALVDTDLKTSSAKLKEIFDIISGNEEHKFSYRTLQDVMEKIQPTKDGKLTMNEFLDAIINLKETIYLKPEEITKLENLKVA